MSMENSLTAAGIEPATFRFVAQHLNHCATAVPNYKKRIHILQAMRLHFVDLISSYFIRSK